ncbi:MAG: 2'-5' RNA ligase family protein [Patescibacteria group bacterium]
MSKIIAINVALLPLKEVNDWAIKLNKELWDEYHLGYKFDDTHLPHITLLMMFVKNDDLPAINQIIKKVADKQKPLLLKAAIVSGKVKYGDEGKLFEYAAFALTPEKTILQLHKALIKSLSQYHQAEADDNAFYKDNNKQIRKGAFNYAKEFLLKYSGNNYEPHLTLFAGKGTDIKGEMEFTANRLANCQQGNFNSCRKILAEWRLKR